MERSPIVAKNLACPLRSIARFGSSSKFWSIPGAIRLRDGERRLKVYEWRRPEAMSMPFKIGVLQLSMEPLQETVRMAQACDAAGFDTFWLAEGYSWGVQHFMEDSA